MKIAVDRNMPLAQEAFATLGEVQVVDGRSLQSKDIRNTTILAIRSTTKVQAALLDGTDVRFVGTATIGTDHLDIPYLEKQNIKWVYSPGCNARSVAEYITAALLHLAITYNQPLKDQTLGIIGVGNVGSRVAAQAEALGMRVLLNDPPRARTEDAQAFCELSMLLHESDYITMHVPLANDGQDPTFHMVNETFLARMKPTAFFINAARGAIVQTPALIKALQHATIRAAVLDTWEGEPAISPELLERATIATPHIAGHSFEGKVNGTLMV
jgi:erythronate-4-phosphate dehydrogenase